jgi:hypothetical protein
MVPMPVEEYRLVCGMGENGNDSMIVDLLC